MKWTFIFLLIQICFLSPTGAADDPRVLARLRDRVEITASYNHTPVIITDLDDTLINTRERTLRIVKEFASLPHIQRRYPMESRKLDHLEWNQIQFRLEDTLEKAQIRNLRLFQELRSYWYPRFFSNRYCENDLPTVGAVDYFQTLSQAGAFLVYLTARDRPLMERGTKLNLTKNHFPLGPRTKLLMKPSSEWSDFNFKKQSIQVIRPLGDVIAIFENEPENLNMLSQAFPFAIPIFVDTVHSPGASTPIKKARWVRNFIY